MNSLGLDIGGANLKAAASDGWHASQFFPLWRQPEQLAPALRELIAQAPPAELIAATMTGELADCFRTKREGVTRIVEALVDAARPRTPLIYLTDGKFVTPQIAVAQPLLAAASNWHALASFVARKLEIAAGVLFDLGSTTCDVIPLVDRRPAAQGQIDPERLATGELVYTGVVRSPICAVTGSIPYRGRPYSGAHELFATTHDAYLTLGELPEEPSNLATADGRPATREFARDRLARCICADRELFSDDDALVAAGAIKTAQLALLGKAARRAMAAMPREPQVVVISGQGEFLLRELVCRLFPQRKPELFAPRSGASVDELNRARVISLSTGLGPDLSRVAPAYAVAMLAASERA